MGFDDEWATLRAEATQRQSTDMRLNGADDGPLPGLGGQVLASTPAEKAAAANTIENELEDSTNKSTNLADEASSAAAKEFTDWATGPAITKLGETWDKQVKTLMGRLSSEKNGLRGAANGFARNDLDINSQFSPLLKPQYGPWASGLGGV
ncbi:hypothetical protein OHA98_10245 [Streptomyces sp. NBC_00654]|uniref:hypothetical protein n=1 Tax=Streptomyces sp. NBC_00654 TaxID=2975799 RepID=UPI002258B22B|nr:hypothetical protein [Streptomyces sp. NBC_00654]MCX4965205.1 hypothetical protein [Streptomyces sp. NBC_00654]